MQTITIDIINNKAIKLLQDLELLQLIRLRKENQEPLAETNWELKYKGSMTKQSNFEIDNQLKELRDGWE
ncbi:MAG: hypothetical protein K9H61_08010 [Bacteroidia bacterium]|nr:hypothetical protein [Bacteroidia bacterium]MCF8446925.1 hypothetical protein [Bacteroidia bacterium]